MWQVVLSDPLTWSLVLLLVHSFVNAKDVGCKVSTWMRKSRKASSSPEPIPDPRVARVNAALEHLMEKNFVYASELLQHSVCFAISVLLYADGTRMIRIGATLVYVVHVSVAHRFIKMSAVHIKAYLVVLFMIGATETLETRHMDPSDVAVMQTLNAVFRVGTVVLHMDPQVHAVGQMVMSGGDILIKILMHGFTPGVVAYVWVEVFVATGTVILSISLEYYMRETLAAQFRSQDAETMVAGFRRMLRGICDGEVLLDGQLRIQGPCGCINQILSSHGDFEGKIFPDLLVDCEEEYARFRDFIATSCKLCASPDMQGSMPPCLRASLQSEHSTRVGVDLFHVSLSNLFGSGEDYHLLALRQDTEPRELPDAGVGAIPRQLLQRLVERSRIGSQAASSDSGTSACSFLQTPQLAEMMLLVNAAKKHQEVCQVHLKYSESTAQGGCAPTLRRFIRPTDWDTVRTRGRGRSVIEGLLLQEGIVV
mmetsp:Transcript_37808/g.88784  ORF Transcript_37808/g.88784 Transcript_37808/m.88784 type:complete len:481 (+) Transcript_37808:65-1507(+)